MDANGRKHPAYAQQLDPLNESPGFVDGGFTRLSNSDQLVGHSIQQRLSSVVVALVEPGIEFQEDVFLITGAGLQLAVPSLNC